MHDRSIKTFSYLHNKCSGLLIIGLTAMILCLSDHIVENTKTAKGGSKFPKNPKNMEIRDANCSKKIWTIAKRGNRI